MLKVDFVKVAFFHIVFPNGEFLNVEECCTGIGKWMTYQSAFGGIASELVDTDIQTKHITNVSEIDGAVTHVLIPFVVGFETLAANIAKDIRQRNPNVVIMALCYPKGLATETQYTCEFTYFIADDNPVKTVLKALDVEAKSRFPVVVPSSIPHASVMTWLLIGSGCPYQCKFCVWAGRKTEWRTPQNTLDSVLTIHANALMIANETSKPYYLCPEMSKTWLEKYIEVRDEMKLSIKFVTDVRLDEIDKDFADVLVQSGCNEVTTGLESCNQRILDEMGKHMDLEAWLNGFKLLNERYIVVNTSLLFGLSDDESPIEYADFVLRNEIRGLRAGICKIYPSTKLFDEIRSSNSEVDWYKEHTLQTEPYMVRKGIEKTLTKLKKFNELMDTQYVKYA